MLMTIILLAVGELICGTSLYFVAMMTIAMASIGITYNFLGGLSTLSGMCFANLALQTFVISQFAKVILREASDKNLEAPYLTITIYAVFYFCAMLGVFVYGRARIRLPRPMEVQTGDQRRVLYIISLTLGLVATVVYQFYTTSYSAEDIQYGMGRSLALAGTPLLLFSLVLAVDRRIIETGKRHSFGLDAIVPFVPLFIVGFMNTVRLEMVSPVLVYFMACYVRGYRLRSKHVIAGLTAALVFVGFISPFALYTRDVIRGLKLRDRIYVSYHTLMTVHDIGYLMAAQELNVEDKGARREEYYDVPGTFLLSRLSLIRADSNVISACSNGFHYGFTAIWIDLLKNIPSFLYPNKPRYVTGQDYIGHVSGMSSDSEYNTYPQLSGIGDSYGSFGWFGVVLFPLFALPLIFVVYESMFDISKPWGTVALGLCFMEMSAIMLPQYLPLLIRTPIFILALSSLMGLLVRMIPLGERRRTTSRSYRGTAVSRNV
jgi:hypothetical protein